MEHMQHSIASSPRNDVGYNAFRTSLQPSGAGNNNSNNDNNDDDDDDDDDEGLCRSCYTRVLPWFNRPPSSSSSSSMMIRTMSTVTAGSKRRPTYHHIYDLKMASRFPVTSNAARCGVAKGWMYLCR